MNTLIHIDYIATSSSSGQAIFRPLTPNALEAFQGLPLDSKGCYQCSDDAEAQALFDRLDEAGLIDLTT